MTKSDDSVCVQPAKKTVKKVWKKDDERGEKEEREAPTSPSSSKEGEMAFHTTIEESSEKGTQKTPPSSSSYTI